MLAKFGILLAASSLTFGEVQAQNSQAPMCFTESNGRCVPGYSQSACGSGTAFDSMTTCSYFVSYMQAQKAQSAPAPAPAPAPPRPAPIPAYQPPAQPAYQPSPQPVYNNPPQTFQPTSTTSFNTQYGNNVLALDKQASSSNTDMATLERLEKELEESLKLLMDEQQTAEDILLAHKQNIYITTTVESIEDDAPRYQPRPEYVPVPVPVAMPVMTCFQPDPQGQVTKLCNQVSGNACKNIDNKNTFAYRTDCNSYVIDILLQTNMESNKPQPNSGCWIVGSYYNPRECLHTHNKTLCNIDGTYWNDRASCCAENFPMKGDPEEAYCNNLPSERHKSCWAIWDWYPQKKCHLIYSDALCNVNYNRWLSEMECCTADDGFGMSGGCDVMSWEDGYYPSTDPEDDLIDYNEDPRMCWIYRKTVKGCVHEHDTGRCSKVLGSSGLTGIEEDGSPFYRTAKLCMSMNPNSRMVPDEQATKMGLHSTDNGASNVIHVHTSVTTQ